MRDTDMSPLPAVPSRWWPAPAKLNLFLHITARREDGYHDLQTLFQILDWGDEIAFTVNQEGSISRSCDIDFIPENEDICVRAAHLLKTHFDVQEGVHMELLKRIPTGAGLGGGSSDAATVLLALNQLWSLNIPLRRLAELGLELGSDVPVFIFGNSALAEGRGEKLQAVALGERHYVLIFPKVSISTADVFQQTSLRRDSERFDLSQVNLRVGRNDCEAVVLEMYPELRAIMFDVRTWGEPHLSGTGSTIFLSFDSKNTAFKAAQELKCRYNVRAVGGTDRSRLLDKYQYGNN